MGAIPGERGDVSAWDSPPKFVIFVGPLSRNEYGYRPNVTTDNDTVIQICVKTE